MKKHYIQAVLEMIRAGQNPDAVLSGLAQVLEVKGHQSLKASVLAGVLRILTAETKRTAASVTVSKAADIEKHKAAITKALSSILAESDYVVHEDAAIIGGFVAQSKNIIYDASYKTALVKLYRNIAK